MLKRLIVLAVAICVALSLTIVVIMKAHPNPVKDLQENPFDVYNEASLNDIMTTLCDEVTWKKVESNHKDRIYLVNVEGKLKDIGIPYLDGYTGAPIGFDVEVRYNDDNVIKESTIRRVYFENKELDLQYDMDWTLQLIYSAYKFVETGFSGFFPNEVMK